jgi:hypothetical protein
LRRVLLKLVDLNRLTTHSTAAAAAPTTSATRPLRFGRCVVGEVFGRRRPIRLSVTRRLDIGRRRRFVPANGELLQSTCGREELVAVDVRVARHRREVGMTEVLGDKAGVADLLAEPGRGCVAQRVGGDVLLDPGALRGSPDDVGEDRLLQASTGETAEDRVGRRGLACVAELQQLMNEAIRQRLTSRLVALPVADEQRGLASVELEVPPLERAQLGATKAGRDEGEKREPVALG